MHALVLVLIPSTGNVEDLVEEAMHPYREDYNEDTDELTGHWDWWQIGGRFTGCLSEYSPHDDPRNIEQCSVCNGTGQRMDRLSLQAVLDGHEKYSREGGWCNGCDGKGERVKWPTGWARHDGDVVDLSSIPDDFESFAVLTPDGFFARRVWNGEDFEDGEVPGIDELKTKHPGMRVAVVDFHS